MAPQATVKVTHFGEDYCTLEIHISRPGNPGETFKLDTTDMELGEALQKAGLSNIYDDEDE